MTWDDFEDELDDEIQKAFEPLLPNFLTRWLYGDLDERRRPYERRREEAKKQIQKELEELRALREQLRVEVLPAKNEKEPLPDNTPELHKRLQEKLETIVRLKSKLDKKYLRQNEIDEILSIKDELNDYNRFIRKRQQREQQREEVIGPVRDDIGDLRVLHELLTEGKSESLASDKANLYDRVGEGLEMIGKLNSRLDYDYLWPQEIDELDQIEATLKKHQQRLCDTLRERATSRFQDDIDELRHLENRLRNDVEPAKTSGETLPDDVLHIEKQLNDRIDTLERLEQDVDKQYLHQQEIDELRNLRETYEEYRTFIPKRHDVESRLYSELGMLRPLRRRVDAHIVPVKESGEPLPDDAAAIEEQLAIGLKTISELKSDLNQQYLHQHEINEIDETERLFKDCCDLIPEKRRFEQLFGPLEKRIGFLEVNATPFLEYEQYLSRHQRETFKEALETVDQKIQRIRSEVNQQILADADRNRVTKIASRRQTIDKHLDGYNSKFVERKIAACDDLFSDIDDEGNDLNEAQRKAVVRNDTYNQVIAAAGTGKTIALIYRVAYLVREQNVPPNRIAALTYTRKAAEEMITRLEKQFDITDVEVRTIHSFAFEIAKDAAEEELRTAQTSDVYNLIDRVIHEETENPTGAFYKHYLQFLAHYEDDYVEVPDFEERADYVAERAEESYETLAGETVASRAEKVIADFLFTHEVDYRYEAIAEWADGADDKDVYRPDFYLPNYNLYIEHWGLDEAGEVAPWFSWTTDEYLEKLWWARSEFADSDNALVETYDFEHQRSPLYLKRVLRHRLEHHGVELDRLDFEGLVDAAFQYHEQEEDIKESFKRFIDNAKTFNIALEAIKERLDERIPRQYHFGRCGEIILRRYNDYLDRNNLVDFDDMIYDAIAAVEQHPDNYKNEYDQLLIDEFQDVSMSQLRLIRQFGGPDGARLFCVGDDWQSIYSFQGSEVEYFIEFEEHIGPAATTRLTANYRCPETVLAAGNELISNNPAQIDKTVTAASGRDETPQLYTLKGYTDNAYERRVGKHAAELVEQCLEGESNPSDVMVLCRYDNAAPYLDEVKKNLERRDIPYDGKDDHFRPPAMPSEYDPGFDSDAGVSVFSVHQSKGREADHVILLHAVEGQFGFPAEDREDGLIAPVRDVATNSVAEERRLFYVGITRGKENLYIQTRQGSESPFVEEIDPYLERVRSVAAPGEVGETTTITAKVDQLFEDPHPTQRQAGVLKDQTGTVRFVSWENENPPTLEVGVWYRLDGVKVNEYEGETQIILRGDADVINLYQECNCIGE